MKITRLLRLPPAWLITSAFAKIARVLNSGRSIHQVPLPKRCSRQGTLLCRADRIQPGTLKLVPGGLKEDARQTMENIKTTLEAHGNPWRDLVK